MVKKKEASGGAGEEREVSFEEAIARLEAIIDRIERGEVGLEESLAEYERGVGLIRRCREVLDRAEQRIAELSIDEAGAKDGDEGGAAARPMESAEEPPF